MSLESYAEHVHVADAAGRRCDRCGESVTPEGGPPRVPGSFVVVVGAASWLTTSRRPSCRRADFNNHARLVDGADERVSHGYRHHLGVERLSCGPELPQCRAQRRP